MQSYEFSCQIAPQTNGLSGSSAGIYAAYLNEQNYVRADLRLTNRDLKVSGMYHGAALPEQIVRRPSRDPLPTSQNSARTWRYTTSDPGSRWENGGFNDAAWSSGSGGFGTPSTPGSVVGTGWYSSDIWIRQNFVIAESATPYTMLRVHHDENAEIYINGLPAAVLPRRSDLPAYTTMYDNFAMEPAARQSLHSGTNTIAVHCHNTAGGQFIDVGIENPKLPADGSGCNLRVVKDNDRILLFADGQELVTVPWGEESAQVGLVTDNTSAQFRACRHEITIDASI